MEGLIIGCRDRGGRRGGGGRAPACARRSHPSRPEPATAARAAAARRSRSAGFATSSLRTVGERRRGHPGAPAGRRRGRAAELGEAADVAEHHRLAEREAGVEDARLLDLADTEGRARRRGGSSAGISGSETNRGRNRTRPGGPGGELGQRLERHPRHPGDPEPRPLDLGEGLEQGVDPLVGAQQPEEQDHRPLRALELAGSGRSSSLLGQVVELPCGITSTLPVGARPRRAAGRRRPRCGRRRRRTFPVAALGGELAMLARLRQRVVEGEHARAAGRAVSRKRSTAGRVVHCQCSNIGDIGGVAGDYGEHPRGRARAPWRRGGAGGRPRNGKPRR